MKTALKPLIAALALVGLASTVHAAKLFAVDLAYSGGSLLVENSSLPDLVDDLIKNNGAFSVVSGEDRFGWQLTPYAGAFAIGSVDGVTAAIVSQYGLVNRFEWRLFERSLVSLVGQYTTFNNLAIKIDEYELTTPID